MLRIDSANEANHKIEEASRDQNCKGVPKSIDPAQLRPKFPVVEEPAKLPSGIADDERNILRSWKFVCAWCASAIQRPHARAASQMFAQRAASWSPGSSMWSRRVLPPTRRMIWVYGIILPLVGSVAYAQGMYTTAELAASKVDSREKQGRIGRCLHVRNGSNPAPIWNI